VSVPNRNLNEASNVSSTPLTFLPATTTWVPSNSGRIGRYWVAISVWICLMSAVRLAASGSVASALSWAYTPGLSKCDCRKLSLPKNGVR